MSLQVAIVKRVVEVKMAENAERKNAIDKAAQKHKLLVVLERKQNAALEELSVEELQALMFVTTHNDKCHYHSILTVVYS